MLKIVVRQSESLADDGQDTQLEHVSRRKRDQKDDGSID